MAKSPENFSQPPPETEVSQLIADHIKDLNENIEHLRGQLANDPNEVSLQLLLKDMLLRKIQLQKRYREEVFGSDDIAH